MCDSNVLAIATFLFFFPFFDNGEILLVLSWIIVSSFGMGLPVPVGYSSTVGDNIFLILWFVLVDALVLVRYSCPVFQIIGGSLIGPVVVGLESSSLGEREGRLTSGRVLDKIGLACPDCNTSATGYALGYR